jgi:UDP-N-acetylmuramoyl-L-alanyl-D-glutamate--2,6-diaminopimelate ligase
VQQTLRKLLVPIDFTLKQGNLDQEIRQIQFDSRLVQAGDVFVAVKGVGSDGHQYITKAIEMGAVAIVCEEIPTTPIATSCAVIQTSDSAKALGWMAAAFYDYPSRKLQLVGITGTNGKTTTTTLLYKLFQALGYRSGLISTVQNYIDQRIYPSTFTTPYPLELQKLLSEMVEAGCTHCFMEVSSHALAQQRVAGLQFAGAGFTNLTHDHLDFHKTFANYLKAKKLLFDQLSKESFAVVNADDKNGLVMLQNCTADTQLTFGLSNAANIQGKLMENTLQGLHLEIDQLTVWFRLIGSFNASNILLVYGIALQLGEDKQEILTVLSGLESASGRFEQIRAASGLTAIVDYAHTPDALENVLKTLNDIATLDQRIITVVGCGGNRDATKRPLMAKIAYENSDFVVLTSDNPRHEEPIKILEDMLTGIPADYESKAVVIEDRKEAIQYACQWATPRDIILVAGKGHETYQEIKGVKYPFDDKAILQEFLS